VHAPENTQEVCAKARSTRRRSRSNWRRLVRSSRCWPSRGGKSSRSRSSRCSRTWAAGRRRTRKLKVREALRALTRRGSRAPGQRRRIEDLKGDRQRRGQRYRVPLDEIDKIASRSEVQGAGRVAAGVQRDLLPLVEGTTVNTKYGMIRTDHVLFIASGRVPSVQAVRPDARTAGALYRYGSSSESLSAADFERILTGTDACLVRQYEGAARHRGREPRIHAGRGIAPGTDRLHDQRALPRHRGAPAAHGDGEAARGHLLRGRQSGRRSAR